MFVDGEMTIKQPYRSMVYKGNFCSRMFEGEGTLKIEINNLKYIYMGEFKGGIPHGKGKLIHSSLSYSYEGGWENGKFHGQGLLKVEYPDDSTKIK